MENSTRLLPTKAFILEGDSPSCIAHLCGRTHPRCPDHEPTPSLPTPQFPRPQLRARKRLQPGLSPHSVAQPRQTCGTGAGGPGEIGAGACAGSGTMSSSPSETPQPCDPTAPISPLGCSSSEACLLLSSKVPPPDSFPHLPQPQRLGRAVHDAPLWPGPAGSQTQLGSRPVPGLFSRHCTTAYSVPATEGCSALPLPRLGPLQCLPRGHTHTPGDGPRLALCLVPQGPGLDLTESYNEP